MTVTEPRGATAQEPATGQFQNPRLRVCVVVPALNEARNLGHVFAALPAGLHGVIAVDGQSIDGTPDVARRLWPGVRLVTQTTTGRGNALACGFAAATGDIIVMTAAGGSTDPAEIPVRRGADLGRRLRRGPRLAPGAGSSDITPLRTLGSRLPGLVVNALYGTRYPDLCCGCSAFRAGHVPAFGLRAGAHERLRGGGFETEALPSLRAAAAGLAVTEVPGSGHPRMHGTSSLRTLRDGHRVLRAIVTEGWRGDPRSRAFPAPTEATEKRR